MSSPKTLAAFQCVVLAASTIGFAIAQTPASNTAAEVQRINESMTLMSARLAELELRAKVAAKEREISQSAGLANIAPLGSSAGNPSVVSVAGLKGQLEAVLVFPGGLVQRVKVGDVIGDRLVSVVAINQVILTDTKTKSTTRLAFGATAAVKEQPAQGLNSPGMPAGVPFGSPQAR
jgi:type IV pilus biogenesis protein PilP